MPLHIKQPHPLPTLGALRFLMSSMEAFNMGRQVLLTWFSTQALPLWSTTGTDWVRGGYAEKISAHGQAQDEPRRTRVVARQLYVFSVARKLGWQTDPTPWLDHGLAFLFDRLRQPDGTYAAGVSPEGEVLNPRFDLYEQAFALFAMASVHRFDKARYAHLPAQAHALMDVLEAGWRHPAQGPCSRTRTCICSRPFWPGPRPRLTMPSAGWHWPTSWARWHSSTSSTRAAAW